MSFIFNGTTINAAYFNETALTQIVINGVSVWTSATTMGIFYSGQISLFDYVNTVTRINSSGTLVGAETSVSIVRSASGGAGFSENALYYGGYNAGVLNIATRINSSGALVGSETNVGTGQSDVAGAGVSGVGLFYTRGSLLRLNYLGAMIGSETTVGFARTISDGAKVGSNGMFYGGYTYVDAPIYHNTVNRISTTGSMVGSETNVGTARSSHGGATSENLGVFYGGLAGVNDVRNTLTRIDSNGNLVGSETNLGTVRQNVRGAEVDKYATFFGGFQAGTSKDTHIFFNTVTRINSSGALVGSEANVGTGRYDAAGAGI
jgi:hypothetical protein